MVKIYDTNKILTNVSINKEKVFNVESLNNSLNNITNIEYKNIEEVKKNYKNLILNQEDIINFCVTNKLCQATILYNWGFYIELYLKYYFLLSSSFSIEQIDNFRHNISEMINKISEVNKLNNIGELKHLMQKYKINGKKINFNDYYNFKYNKEIGSSNLMFDFKISEENVLIIVEVIKWLKTNI